MGGGLSTFGYSEFGGGLTLVSSAVDSVVSEIENSKKKEQERLIEFLQDFANLERNYQNLKKILADLTLINENSTLPETVNQALAKFSQLVNKLQESMNLCNSDVSNAEQELNKVRNKHFIQHLQENYAEINKVLFELEEAINETAPQLEARIEIVTETTPLISR